MWRESIVDGVGKTVRASALQQKWGQRIVLPDHRWGEVEEIANLVAFAASPVCGFATGAIFVADGGESHN